MSLQLEPYTWNWATIATGNTYPASQFVESASDYDATLVRVIVKIMDANGATHAQLDSATGGIIINEDAAGEWDFTIGSLDAPQVAGTYTVEVDCFDSDNVEATFTRGTWEII
jgi:hypothetical protein